MSDDIRPLVEAALKKKILEAFNEGPELIDKMIAVAIVDYKVDDSGFKPKHGNGMPFIDFVIGQQIRQATRDATREVIADQIDALKAQIAKRLTDREFADAAVSAMLDKLSDDWRVNVEFKRTDQD